MLARFLRKICEGPTTLGGVRAKALMGIDIGYYMLIPIAALVVILLLVKVLPQPLSLGFALLGPVAFSAASLVFLRVRTGKLGFRSASFWPLVTLLMCGAGFVFFLPLLVRFPEVEVGLLSILFGALSEELIFRFVLPRALTDTLTGHGASFANAALISIVALQISFAASHFVGQSLFFGELWEEV